MQYLRRTIAFVLTLALCAEALLGNGVASAVALTLDELGSLQESVQASVDTGTEAAEQDATSAPEANDSAAVGLTGSAAQSLTADDQAVAVQSQDADDQDDADQSDWGTVVSVMLDWRDGDDGNRHTVKVAIYAARTISFPDSRTAYYKDTRICTISLSADNGWSSSTSIPVSGLSPRNDFYVRVVSSDDYNVVTRDRASELGSLYASLLSCWPDGDDDDRLVSTDSTVGSAYRLSTGFDSGSSSYVVTATRVGSVDLSINNTWLDQGADASKRPSTSFNVSSSLSEHIEFVYDAAGWVYARVPGLRDMRLSKMDRNGASSPLIQGRDVSISSDRKSFSIIASTDTSGVPFTIVGLPLCDGDGAAFDWYVNQSWTGEHGDYAISESAPVLASSGPWHHQDQLDCTFAIRREGTKSVTYHAKWYDHYIKDELDRRPDLSLSLYRLAYGYNEDGTLSGESHLEKVDANAGAWQASAAEDRIANDSAGGDFTRYATFEGLPKYDDHGKMNVYYVLPELSAAEGSEGTISYGYEVSAEQSDYSVDPGSWTGSDSELASEAASLEVDGTTVYREDATLCCRVEGTTSLQGSKLWTNIPDGFTSESLPGISVYLQRRMAAGSYDDSGAWTAGALVPWRSLRLTLDASQPHGYVVRSSANGLVSTSQGARPVVDGQTAVAWQSISSRQGFDWSFSFDRLGDNDDATSQALPAFDEEGRLFEYRVREVVDGMIGLDALNSSAISASSSSDNLEAAFGNVFDVSYAGFSISNNYKSVKGSLTVRKVFAGCDAQAKLPDVAATFRLYRYYVGASGQASGLEFVGEKTLGAEDVSNGLGNVTFTGLDVYAPTGSKWNYVAFEAASRAYDASSGLGALEADSGAASYRSSDEWAAANGVSHPAGLDSSWAMGPTVVADEGNAAAKVTFKGTYAPETTELVGAVVWTDNDNAFNTRPSGLTLTLMRTYEDGSLAPSDGSRGQIALQDSDPQGKNYVSWNKGADNTWTYAISNVDKLATDGNAWKFEIEEGTDQVSGQYRVAADGRGGSYDSEVGAFPTIANALVGQAGFSLAWSGDADDAWGQRPVAYVVLQARVAGSDGEWKEAGSFFVEHGADASKLNAVADYDGTGLTAHTFPSSQNPTVVKLGTDSYDSPSAWSYLPIKVGDAAGNEHAVEYRVAEALLVYDKDADGGDKVTISLNCSAEGQYSTAVSDARSPYMPIATLETQGDGSHGTYAWKSTISNVYDVATTSLSVSMAWDDGDNAMDTRPGASAAGDAWSTTFVLQRSSDGGKTWQWFTRYGAAVDKPFNDDSTLNANLLTFELTSSRPQVTLDDLPATIAGVGSVSSGYRYRAVELVKGSYRVAAESSGVLATNADKTQRLETVPVDNNGAQPFVSQLMTEGISGKVVWNDWGSGLADDLDPSDCGIAFKLYRSVAGGAEELVQAVDSTGVLRDVAPVWTRNADGTWSYSFKNCALTDQEGRAYAYRLEEVGIALDGWCKTDMDANGTIFNTASRLSFDAAMASGGTETDSSTQLDGVTFEVRNASGVIVAMWSRDSKGEVTVSVEPGFGKGGSGQSAGWIVGLPAGEYTVHEAKAPEGHLPVADFTIRIDVDGRVSVGGGSDGGSLGGDGLTIVIPHEPDSSVPEPEPGPTPEPAPTPTPEPGDNDDHVGKAPASAEAASKSDRGAIPSMGDSSLALSCLLASLGLMALAWGLKRSSRR